MIGSGSRGTDSTAVGQGMQPGVRSVASGRGVKVAGAEAKVIQALMKALDSISFDQNRFAALLSMSSVAFQRRFLSVFYPYFCNLAEKYERGAWMDDEELELFTEGIRLRDAIRPFM